MAAFLLALLLLFISIVWLEILQIGLFISTFSMSFVALFISCNTSVYWAVPWGIRPLW